MTHLSLNLSYSYLGDKEVEIFSIGLKEMKNLSMLNVDFSHNHLITDKSVETFLHTLKGLLSSLTGLKLSFEACKEVYNIGKEHLITLESFKVLSKYKLHYFQCYSVTDEGKETFTVSPTSIESMPALYLDLKSLKGLSVLSLNLNPYCQEICDCDIEEL